MTASGTDATQSARELERGRCAERMQRGRQRHCRAGLTEECRALRYQGDGLHDVERRVGVRSRDEEDDREDRGDEQTSHRLLGGSVMHEADQGTVRRMRWSVPHQVGPTRHLCKRGRQSGRNLIVNFLAICSPARAASEPDREGWMEESR
jgi:hypothetical protein